MSMVLPPVETMVLNVNGTPPPLWKHNFSVATTNRGELSNIQKNEVTYHSTWVTNVFTS